MVEGYREFDHFPENQLSQKKISLKPLPEKVIFQKPFFF